MLRAVDGAGRGRYEATPPMVELAEIAALTAEMAAAHHVGLALQPLLRLRSGQNREPRGVLSRRMRSIRPLHPASLLAGLGP
jgi:hypothetical protein